MKFTTILVLLPLLSLSILGAHIPTVRGDIPGYHSLTISLPFHYTKSSISFAVPKQASVTREYLTSLNQLQEWTQACVTCTIHNQYEDLFRQFATGHPNIVIDLGVEVMKGCIHGKQLVEQHSGKSMQFLEEQCGWHGKTTPGDITATACHTGLHLDYDSKKGGLCPFPSTH